jgi:predicted RNase H-like nuclease (RuvC/YqgF family)
LSKYIIAGIDPGATVGIAILDLSGRKIASQSMLGGGIAEAVAAIERHGTPSIVACDVWPAPEMAQKMASYFSCRLYCPQRSIREEDKREIARGAAVSNNHERDAYAAAVLAFRAHANKLRQIGALDDFSPQDKDRAKHLVLKGYRLKDAFLEIAAPAQEQPPAPALRESEGHARLPSQEELRLRISALARENANLRILAGRLESEKRQLEARLRLLENGVRQSLLRDSEFRHLRYQLQAALSRLSERKKGTRKPPAQPQKSSGRGGEAPKKGEGGVLNVEEEKIDLEAMVMDYRRGRNRTV